jgi:hypothetical protein
VYILVVAASVFIIIVFKKAREFIFPVYFGPKFYPHFFWGILFLEFPLGISETSLLSMSTPQAKIDLLMVVHQLLLSFE